MGYPEFFNNWKYVVSAHDFNRGQTKQADIQRFNRFQIPVQGNKTVKTVQLSSFSQIPRLKSRVEKFGITHVLVTTSRSIPDGELLRIGTIAIV